MRIVLALLFVPFLILGVAMTLRQKRVLGTMLIGFFAMATLVLLNPELISAFANAIGIGRGVDLVFYLFLPLSLFLNLALFTRTKNLDRKLEMIVREVALYRAKEENR